MKIPLTLFNKKSPSYSFWFYGFFIYSTIVFFFQITYRVLEFKIKLKYYFFSIFLNLYWIIILIWVIFSLFTLLRSFNFKFKGFFVGIIQLIVQLISFFLVVGFASFITNFISDNHVNLHSPTKDNFIEYLKSEHNIKINENAEILHFSQGGGKEIVSNLIIKTYYINQNNYRPSNSPIVNASKINNLDKIWDPVLICKESPALDDLTIDKVELKNEVIDQVICNLSSDKDNSLSMSVFNYDKLENYLAVTFFSQNNLIWIKFGYY